MEPTSESVPSWRGHSGQIPSRTPPSSPTPHYHSHALSVCKQAPLPEVSCIYLPADPTWPLQDDSRTRKNKNHGVVGLVGGVGRITIFSHASFFYTPTTRLTCVFFAISSQLSSPACCFRVREGCEVSPFCHCCFHQIFKNVYFSVWDPEGRKYIDMLSAYS